MQRADFPELQGRQRPSGHQRPGKPDRVLIALKVATFMAACGVLGVIVLLALGGPGPASPAAAPPKIIKGQLGDDAPQTIPTPATPKAVVAPPALRTETAEITRTPTSSKLPAPTTQPPVPPAPSLPAVGQPCAQPGMWSVTPNFEPVFCSGDSPPRWRRVF
jgi:hypothetical protein